MQKPQYPKISDEEYQTMINSPVAKDMMRRSEVRMRYLHDTFLKDFYKKFPEFYVYIFESEENYLMVDLWDNELRAIPDPIMWTLLRYIEILLNQSNLDEVKSILTFLENWYQSEDLEIRDLVIGFINDIYIVPDIISKIVKLLPPGMHKHFMENNSDLLNELN